MKDCPAFNQWANKLLQMGVTMDEIHKLWNENCGKLPKVEAKMNLVNDTTPDIIDNDSSDDDEIMTGVSIDDDDDLDDSVNDNDMTNTTIPV